jgi:hypothetical protein
MNTRDYISSLDREERASEHKRLFYTEPLNAFLATLPKSIKNEEYAKLFIEANILRKHRVYKVNDLNRDMFNSGVDFVYDQLSGYVMFDLGGQHSHVMLILWAIRNPEKVNVDFTTITSLNRASSLGYDIYDYFASKYIEDGYGFFMSSALSDFSKRKITLSQNFMFKKEKHIFKDFKFSYIED